MERGQAPPHMVVPVGVIVGVPFVTAAFSFSSSSSTVTGTESVAPSEPPRSRIGSCEAERVRELRITDTRRDDARREGRMR
jgi:hypothetical protein